MDDRTIGFVGLGLMGRAMAGRLVAAGWRLAVWNRTAARAQELSASRLVFEEGEARGPRSGDHANLGPTRFAGERVSVAGSPAEAAESADVVLLSLTDDAAVDEVLLGPSGVLAGARSGTIVANTSTIAPETARRHAARAAERGVRLLDAPISGSARVAEEGGLVFMVGGERAAFEVCGPIFAELGKAAYHLGDSGAGATMKLVVNNTLAGIVAVLSESLCLGKKAGLDPATMVEIISQTSSGAPVVKVRGPLMAERRYPPMAPVRLMSKDLSLVLATARALSVPMPAAALAAQLYEAQANRDGDQDFASVFELLQAMAGIG